jgi:hypothetical protein
MEKLDFCCRATYNLTARQDQQSNREKQALPKMQVREEEGIIYYTKGGAAGGAAGGAEGGAEGGAAGGVEGGAAGGAAGGVEGGAEGGAEGGRVAVKGASEGVYYTKEGQEESGRAAGRVEGSGQEGGHYRQPVPVQPCVGQCDQRVKQEVWNYELFMKYANLHNHFDILKALEIHGERMVLLPDGQLALPLYGAQ